jgi:UPF0176 protein
MLFLLYYQYVSINNPAKIVEEQQLFCESSGLYGRIRVSKEGINGTLSGEDDSIHSYIAFMNNHPELGIGEPIDWKVSSPLENRPISEQIFTNLSVKTTKEVVSLDLSKREASILRQTPRGTHLTPEEFHNAIDQKLKGNDDSNIVLLDVRNFYETRIGKFAIDDTIPTIDPLTRKVQILVF